MSSTSGIDDRPVRFCCGICGEDAGDESGESPRVAVGTRVWGAENDGGNGRAGTEGRVNSVRVYGAEGGGGGGEGSIGVAKVRLSGEGGADMRRELPLECGVSTGVTRGAGEGGGGARLVGLEETWRPFACSALSLSWMDLTPELSLCIVSVRATTTAEVGSPVLCRAPYLRLQILHRFLGVGQILGHHQQFMQHAQQNDQHSHNWASLSWPRGIRGPARWQRRWT